MKEQANSVIEDLQTQTEQIRPATDPGDASK